MAAEDQWSGWWGKKVVNLVASTTHAKYVQPLYSTHAPYMHPVAAYMGCRPAAYPTMGI